MKSEIVRQRNDLEGQIDELNRVINTVTKMDALLNGYELVRIAVVCQAERGFGMSVKDYPELAKDIHELIKKHRSYADLHLNSVLEKAKLTL